ncbi:hypothetical protein ABEF95_005299 [Exophiala dermatitidis]
MEPYRDHYGVRAECEGAVCISDPDETSILGALIGNSAKFILLLPEVVISGNGGKAPFEPDVFKAQAFAKITLDTSDIYQASSLSHRKSSCPQYNDICEVCGSLKAVFANLMNANNSPHRPCHHVHPVEMRAFRSCNHIVWFLVTSIHELLGDRSESSHDLIKGKPADTWYRSGQTWTGKFGKLATLVEECRAMLVPSFLADNEDMLAISGYDDRSTFTADDHKCFAFGFLGGQRFFDLVSVV